MTSNLYLLFRLAVRIAMLAAAPAAARRPARPTGDLDAYIERAMKDWNVAGVSVAVVNGDSVVYLRGFGVRETGKPQRVDGNTVFAIGSNTKLFTAVAAGMLVDDGALGWDDPVLQYLPDFQLYDPWVTHEVTIRDLLSHRTGLGEQRGNMIALGADRDRADVIRRMRYLPRANSFRSHFAYQNLGLLAAGEAAARATRQNWDTLISRRILEPLGMSSTSTSVRALTAEADVAMPHTNIEGRLSAMPWRNIDNIGPAGSINSSAADMAKWLRFLLAGEQAREKRLLRESTLREIESPQTIVPCPTDSLRPSVHFCAYGLGVLMNDYMGLKVLSHTGGIDGMLSAVTLVPERRLGIVVLTNTDGRNLLFLAIARRILDAYVGAPPRDWSAILLAQQRELDRALLAFKTAAEERRAKDIPPTLSMSAYAGEYSNPAYGTFIVSDEEGRLFIHLGATMAGELTPWSHDTFRLTWQRPEDRYEFSETFVSFELDAFGQVRSLRVRDDVTRPAGQGVWDADEFTRGPGRRPM